jgi:chromate transporter
MEASGAAAAPSEINTRARLGEVARLFLKLGFTAFGGPAAHIAMMEDVFVTRRQWLTREHFLDLVGATNLIPGPNSTEMTMHIGYERAGTAGLFVAGACFIGPAALITGIFAWLYVQYGALPEVEPFLYGVKPTVLAIILGAVWRLGRSAIKGWRLAVLGTAVLAASLAGMGEIVALFAGGLIGMVWLQMTRQNSSTAERMLPVLFLQRAQVQADTVGVFLAAAGAGGVSLWKLGLFFLKIGSVLYGSGYVLIAFLEGGLVEDYGWLTQQQLMDAVAVGQFTPGPVFSAATFIGYILEGVPGALVATAAIFLPSFFFVLLLNPLIPKLRRSAWMSAFLDAVNVAAIALMLAVTIELGITTLRTWPAWIIALTTGFLTVSYRVNAAWLILSGAVLGWVLTGLV